MHDLYRKLILLGNHFFEWLKTANFSTACETSTLKRPPSRGSDAPHVHPRLRKRPPGCTLDCGFKTAESPALRGFEAERCPITGTSLYLVIPNILSILVILNKYQTLVLQAADKFASPYIVACAKLLLLPFFLLLLYLLSKSKNRFNFKTPIGYAGVTLISSAILSTVLDSLIYKGTPDYFYLIPLYSSVDLKDVFAFLGAGCILSIISTNEKNTQKKTTNMEAK